jgi:UDP-N-acetyl-D-mannosaminuronic acid transferase (WecB/TagA/CpsF family)
MMHCKNSPLRRVSDNFLRNHPNPYMDVFERLANSPNAHGIPPNPIWPEVAQEIDNAAQRIYLLETTPEQALRQAQTRLQERYDRYMDLLRRRDGITGDKAKTVTAQVSR